MPAAGVPARPGRSRRARRAAGLRRVALLRVFPASASALSPGRMTSRSGTRLPARWRRETPALRYCHYVDDAEHSALVAATGLTEVVTFRADGETGDMNRIRCSGKIAHDRHPRTGGRSSSTRSSRGSSGTKPTSPGGERAIRMHLAVGVHAPANPGRDRDRLLWSASWRASRPWGALGRRPAG